MSSQELVEWVRSPERREQIALALPEGVSIDRFERATVTALVAKPDLANADRASLYLALLNAAQAGLVPDGKQGAIVVYKTKVKDAAGNEQWIEKAQFLAMIGGVRDTLAEYGWSLRTACIYANDFFEDHSSEGLIVHRPVRPGMDRGAFEGAYAMAVHKDGRREALAMSKAEIDKVRDKSSRSKKVWEDWYDRMAEKTPAHRLAKKLPLDPKDKARLDAVLKASETEPAEALASLYGPDGAEFIVTELPTGAAAGAESQQAETVVPDEAATVSAPGDDDEPLPPAAQIDEIAKAKAAGVASTVATSGAWEGQTFAKIAVTDNGPEWLAYALKHPEKFDADFNTALELYVRGALPETWEKHTEAQAA